MGKERAAVTRRAGVHGDDGAFDHFTLNSKYHYNALIIATQLMKTVSRL